MPRNSMFWKAQAPAQVPDYLPATLPELWAQAYKHAYPPHIFLYADKAPEPRFERYPELFSLEDKLDRISYKQLNASAHCLGAYMLLKGLKQGDRVIVLAENRPVYADFDLGIQLMGAVNLTLPLETDSGALAMLLERHAPKFVCLSGYGLYERHRHILEKFALRGEVLVRSFNHDELQFTDRLVTLEALEDQGKNYWREHQRAVAECSAKVRASHPSAIIYEQGVARGAEPRTFTHKEVLFRARKVVQAMGSISGRHVAVVNAAPCHTLLNRVAGLYAPLLGGCVVVCAQELGALPRATPKLPVELIGLATPAGIHLQQTCIFAQLKPRRARRLQEALRLTQERLVLEQQKEKLPFLKRRRLASIRRGLLRPLREQHFPRLQRVLCHPWAQLQPDQTLLMEALDLPLVQAFE